MSTTTIAPDRPPPTTAAIAIGTAIVSIVVGYFIGQAQAIGVFGGNGTSRRGLKSGKEGEQSGSDDEEDEEEEEDLLEEQEQEECKLVLVVRTDLGMGKGKIAAQCSHATLACYKKSLSRKQHPQNPFLRSWESQGQAKIALKSDGGEDELLLLQAQAVSLGLCAQIIHDAGRTQIASGSATVLGIGPAPKSLVDRVTGGLKLL